MKGLVVELQHPPTQLEDTRTKGIETGTATVEKAG